MKNKINKILLFVGLIIFFFVINYFNVINIDLIWNYGFCFNFAKGMTMYKDYNMVITPFYPFLIGGLMKLLGNNMIIFYILNSMIPASIMMLILKISKKAFIPCMLLLSFVSVPNYNLLCILLLFILIYLEKKDANDYLIGLVLGITFLTKINVGVLVSLPTIYYLFKDYKKVIKRVIGFLIPNLICITIFYFNNSLYDYINYCFLGLFDFARENIKITPLIVLPIIITSYLIKKYLESKDITILYILLYQLISYPIFNAIHIMYASIPFIYYIMENLEGSLNTKYEKNCKLLIPILLCPILGVILSAFTHEHIYVSNTFKNRYVDKELYTDAMDIDSIFKGKYDNVYFVMYSAYLNKFILNLDINKYDLLMQGNLGYDGENRIINEFQNMHEIYFVIYENYREEQTSELIYNYVKNNTTKIKIKGKYGIYHKD